MSSTVQLNTRLNVKILHIKNLTWWPGAYEFVLDPVRPLQLLLHDEPAEGLGEEEVEDGEDPEDGQGEVHLQAGPA